MLIGNLCDCMNEKSVAEAPQEMVDVVSTRALGFEAVAVESVESASGRGKLILIAGVGSRRTRVQHFVGRY